MRRIALFVLANLAVLLSLTLAAEWAGLSGWIDKDDTSLGNLFLLSAILILFGAIVPAAFSKWAAKKTMVSHVITQPRNASETWLIDTLQRQSKLAGIKMPEVAVYESNAMHAYATGLNKDSALIAVSSGLLRRMEREEAEAILKKKIRQIARGDILIPIFFSLVMCWMVVRIQHEL